MEKRQSELCLEILRRFNKAGILKDFILIGSWCVYFYKDYFSNVPYIDQATIKTRDIDFLISNPSGIRQEVNVPILLKDLGFVTTIKGSRGYIKLDHPDLLLEPEKTANLGIFVILILHLPMRRCYNLANESGLTNMHLQGALLSYGKTHQKYQILLRGSYPYSLRGDVPFSAVLPKTGTQKGPSAAYCLEAQSR
ncbi:MAG: hypothetical protein Q8N61_03400, partial [bacterium]|nr:hypothetical protein [bacterium]